MLRITKLTDYGVFLLSQIAGAEERLSARDLADQSSIPLPMVGKVLKLLARGGILESQRGVNGGYSLARAPHKVSLADVLVALEGPIAITDCSEKGADHQCVRLEHCPAGRHWRRINRAIGKVLATVTLDQMLKDDQDHDPGPEPVDDRAAHSRSVTV